MMRALSWSSMRWRPVRIAMAIAPTSTLMLPEQVQVGHGDGRGGRGCEEVEAAGRIEARSGGCRVEIAPRHLDVYGLLSGRDGEESDGVVLLEGEEDAEEHEHHDDPHQKVVCLAPRGRGAWGAEAARIRWSKGSRAGRTGRAKLDR